MVQGLLVWANLEVYLESKVDPWVWRSGLEKDEELGWGCQFLWGQLFFETIRQD